MMTDTTLRRFSAPAHCMDADFCNELKRLGCRVADASEAPWNVTFEGPAAALRQLYDENWADGGWPGFDPEAS
jgi:hypothetical protein